MEYNQDHLDNKHYSVLLLIHVIGTAPPRWCGKASNNTSNHALKRANRSLICNLCNWGSSYSLTTIHVASIHFFLAI